MRFIIQVVMLFTLSTSIAYAQDSILSSDDLRLERDYDQQEELILDDSAFGEQNNAKSTMPIVTANDFIMPIISIPNDVDIAINACVNFNLAQGQSNPKPTCACSTGYMAALLTPLEFHTFTKMIKDGYEPQQVSANIYDVLSRKNATQELLAVIDKKMSSFGQMADRVCSNVQ